MASFVRIAVLTWTDILAHYAMWVMVNYLTNVWKLSFTHAAGIVNIWTGISMILPIPFAFLVDAFFGHYLVLLISTVSYTLGLGFLAMSTPPVLYRSTHTCHDYKAECIGETQKALFYTALALISVGLSGHLVTLTQFYDKNVNADADTNNTENEKESGCKLELQLLGLFFVILFTIIAGFALPYIKPWSIRFGIPAICSFVSTVLFLSGSCGFTDIDPKGSPITTIFRVLVASTSKISKRVPDDVTLLYKEDANANANANPNPNPNPNGPNPPQSAPNLRRLRCLYKAAVVLPNRPRQEQVNNRWTLCSVSEVEETKSVIRMIPMWTTFIICGLVLSIGNTYFLEQGNHMNRHLGRLKIPLPFFLVLYDSTKYVCIKLYTSIKVNFKRYGPPIGIGLAMVFSVLCCITAAKMEFRRIGVIRRHNLLDKPNDNIPMSLFLLLPQFLLLAALDGFSQAGITDFFASQAPPSMKNYLMHFTNGVLGVGIAGSALSVYIVGKVSENNGKSNWFRHTLNRSRLDKYYWTLAALSGVNLVVYVVVACLYSYRDRGGDLAAENQESPTPFEDNAQCCSCFSN